MATLINRETQFGSLFITDCGMGPVDRDILLDCVVDCSGFVDLC